MSVVPTPVPAPTPATARQTFKPSGSLPPMIPPELKNMGVPDQYAPLISKAAQQNGVPAKILAGIAKHESAGTFDPNINEYSGGLGRGMFQIDLGQHSDISEQQAKDPYFSSNYAAKMLADNYKQYGNWDDAIKAYNAGNPYSTAPGYNGQPVNVLANQYLDQVKSAMGE